MSAISISSAAVPQPLSSTPPIPGTSLRTYLKERRAELQQLNEALKSGDLNAAQQAYNNIVALGNQVLHKDNAFLRSDRGLDFNAIGGALQNGDLAGAQHAFAVLQSTFGQKVPVAENNSGAVPATVVDLSKASGEIALNSGSSAGSEAASQGGVNIVA